MVKDSAVTNRKRDAARQAYGPDLWAPMQGKIHDPTGLKPFAGL